MKLRYVALGLILLIPTGSLRTQPSASGRLFVPFLNKESQSNVVVNVSDAFGDGQPCPEACSNVLSNTNLFTTETRKLLEEVFIKYGHVTTNSGPPGTVLIGLRKTNFLVKALNNSVGVTNWMASYQYTNLEAQEEIAFGKGISAKFRNKANNGYNVNFVRTGNSTRLRFTEIKADLASGTFAEFDDAHPQGTNWDFKLANFSNGHLIEYRQYTNGFVFGRFLMWNLRNGKLTIDAEFKDPYDWKKHYQPFTPR